VIYLLYVIDSKKEIIRHTPLNTTLPYNQVAQLYHDRTS